MGREPTKLRRKLDYVDGANVCHERDRAAMDCLAMAEIVGLDYDRGRPDGVAQPGRRIGVKTRITV